MHHLKMVFFGLFLFFTSTSGFAENAANIQSWTENSLFLRSVGGLLGEQKQYCFVFKDRIIKARGDFEITKSIQLNDEGIKNLIDLFDLVKNQTYAAVPTNNDLYKITKPNSKYYIKGTLLASSLTTDDQSGTYIKAYGGQNSNAGVAISLVRDINFICDEQ